MATKTSLPIDSGRLSPQGRQNIQIRHRLRAVQWYVGRMRDRFKGVVLEVAEFFLESDRSIPRFSAADACSRFVHSV